mmetsp:Transcript_10220/g.25089  ORF Transcript_10220/g.25089 Transcript_10220/m.25089 type:complete len:219 (+) Transcript_10220:317-973(+)
MCHASVCVLSPVDGRSLAPPNFGLNRRAERARYDAGGFDQVVPRDAPGTARVDAIHDRCNLLHRGLPPVVKPLRQLEDLRPLEPALAVHVELHKHLAQLLHLVRVKCKELLPRLPWRRAPGSRPFGPLVRHHPEGIEHNVGLLLVNLVEQRCEDAPHLLQLARRHEERLVAQGRVEEHALVSVANVSIREILIVRHVHDRHLRDKREAWHLGSVCDVE